MATYSELTDWIKANHGFVSKSCWIAHVKCDCGLPVRQAPNRQKPTQRVVPCPPEKRPAILAALKHFKMI
jgi:hypothetical protein